MKVLVTGGAGYIGSHTCVELLQAGHDCIVVDNFVNSSMESLNRVEKITGKSIKLYTADVCDYAALNRVFAENEIDSVIHFAGLKAVGESVSIPLRYYQNNFLSTLNLLEVMKLHGVKNFVFSSSATVYGDPHTVPILEDFPLSATNPYGKTKLYIEEMLRDIYRADNSWNIALLRYFNPIGAHKSGLIGENPNGIPNNLVPYVTQVAIGKLKQLNIFGGDWPTHDGTGVRDYIHVVDLALGHLAALEKLAAAPGLVTYNLGTGKGYSVLDIVHAMEKAVGHPIAHKIGDRRPGDIAACYADPAKAAKELGWTAKATLEEMCADSWRWQSQNPNGFKS